VRSHLLTTDPKERHESCQQKKAIANHIDKEHQMEAGQYAQERLRCTSEHIEARYANARAHYANFKPQEG
jgi:hypothetical protein